MDGSGEIKNNYIDTFEFGIIVFGSGFNVHDNTVVNTPLGAVVNYSGRDGIIENNLDQLAPALVTDAVGNGGSGAGNLALLTNYLASTFVTAAGEGTGAVVAAQSSDQEFLAKPMA
jgi:hypothetical protein